MKRKFGMEPDGNRAGQPQFHQPRQRANTSNEAGLESRPNINKMLDLKIKNLLHEKYTAEYMLDRQTK